MATRPLFYVDTVPAAGAPVTVAGDEGHHAATVRRIRVGEELDLADGVGTLAHVRVTAVTKGHLTADVLDRRTVVPATPTVTVVQAVPKSDRAELAVELATEAGADAVVAWQADRCVARWDGPKADRGRRRWEAVARSAARQSRRARVPVVDGPFDTAGLVARLAAAHDEDATAVTLVLHESARTVLAAADVAGAAAVTVVVGPEGGIGDDELARLGAAGARPVRLGPDVLRTSSAAAVALGALGVLTGRWEPQVGEQKGAAHGLGDLADGR